MNTYIVHAKHSMYPEDYGMLTYFFCDLDEARQCKKEIEEDTNGTFCVDIYKANKLDTIQN